jgi:hypothetical protein
MFKTLTLLERDWVSHILEGKFQKQTLERARSRITLEISIVKKKTQPNK